MNAHPMLFGGGRVKEVKKPSAGWINARLRTLKEKRGKIAKEITLLEGLL